MTNIIRATVPALDELLGIPFPILDHGFIRVIDYMGNDEAIVQAARVSYGQGTKTVSSDAGLIDYLMRHRHTTPFEMCEIKLHIKLPIFVARQWIRHRTASVNEVSGRYSKLPAEFFVPECEAIRAQSKTNTQGRDEELPLDITSMFLTKCQQNTNIFENYERAVEVGIARELARINLPLSTYTEWYWKIDLHNLLHFLNLRCDSHAQYEIRTYANKICDLVAVWVPTAYAAFVEYRLNAMQLSASALSVVKNLLASRPVTQESSGMSNREWWELMKILER